MKLFLLKLMLWMGKISWLDKSIKSYICEEKHSCGVNIPFTFYCKPFGVEYPNKIAKNIMLLSVALEKYTADIHLIIYELRN